MSEVTIFTDGACRGNPGVGGWGAVLTSGDHRKEINGVDPNTTNNRMELLAAIRALEALKRRSEVHLYTDSTYVKKGITEWLTHWKKNNWKTAARKPVKNAELWQRLAELVKGHSVSWHWIKGHAGHPGNERADALANEAIDQWMSEHKVSAI